MPMFPDIPEQVQHKLTKVIRSCQTTAQLDNCREWLYRLSRQRAYNPTHVQHFLDLCAHKETRINTAARRFP